MYEIDIIQITYRKMLVKTNEAKKIQKQIMYYNSNLLKIRIFFRKSVLEFRKFLKNTPMHFQTSMTII